MRRFLIPACLLLLAAGAQARAGGPGHDYCCSNYPVYLCPPGYLGWPAPPGEYAPNGACGNTRGWCDYDYVYGHGYVGCPYITPNAYSCCFYGVTLSNYALVTPLAATLPGVPKPLPVLPPPHVKPEKLPEPTGTAVPRDK